MFVKVLSAMAGAGVETGVREVGLQAFTFRKLPALAAWLDRLVPSCFKALGRVVGWASHVSSAPQFYRLAAFSLGIQTNTTLGNSLIVEWFECSLNVSRASRKIENGSTKKLRCF